jgi:hypothetical protein
VNKKRTVVCTLAGLLTLACSTNSVMAQTRAALVKNVDEKGRNPYEAIVPCTATPDTSVCFVNIAPVPAGKRLVLEYVHAFIYTGTSYAPFVTIDSEDGGTLAGFAPTGIGSSFYVVNSPLLLYVEPGKRVYFRAGGVAPAGYAGSVTFTGYLVDLD